MAHWIGLILQLPLKPAYHRVKIWRRLSKLGAINIKNAFYILPKNNDTLEDFQWLKREIENLGGEGILIEPSFIGGLNDPELKALFIKERKRDYSILIEDIKPLLEVEDFSQSLRRLEKAKKQLNEIANIDFFNAPEKAIALSLLAQWEKKLLSKEPSPQKRAKTKIKHHNAVWVTRESVGVDRMACAWLIRRFIDKRAKFKFVADKTYQPKQQEICYDMFSGEFTHRGEKCTFEILVDSFALKKRGLAKIAKIVHDMDFKDNKFELNETPGIKALIEGVQKIYADDSDRLAQSALIFDSLYASLVKDKKNDRHSNLY